MMYSNFKLSTDPITKKMNDITQKLLDDDKNQFVTSGPWCEEVPISKSRVQRAIELNQICSIQVISSELVKLFLGGTGNESC